jgi:bacteriorhodopsin
MVRAARYAFVALALAFAAGIVLQVFFIGLGLFVGPENLELHRNFGWLLHLAPLLVLVAAAAAGAGRTRILQAVALVVVVWIVPILAAVRADLPVVAAFHPVGALLAFALSLVVARGSLELARDVNQDARTTRGEWILVAVVVVLVLFVSLSGSPEA